MYMKLFCLFTEIHKKNRIKPQFLHGYWKVAKCENLHKRDLKREQISFSQGRKRIEQMGINTRKADQTDASEHESVTSDDMARQKFARNLL